MKFLELTGEDKISLLIEGDPSAETTVLLAHGAGAPMDTEFMSFFANALVNAGHQSIRFEFPYMTKRRQDAKKRPPDRQPKLIDAFAHVLRHISEHGGNKQRLFIGGKSMGGRMATLVAAEKHETFDISGAFALGYPFHPPGKPSSLRTDHFSEISVPVLICQGERDTFGNKTEVPGYDIPETFKINWLPDGNHDLAPRKASGLTKLENWQVAADSILELVR